MNRPIRWPLLGLLLALGCALGMIRPLPAQTTTVAPPPALVVYTIRDPGPPLPGLLFSPTIPWLGWAGALVAASVDGDCDELTIYLPSGGESSCPPGLPCIWGDLTYWFEAGPAGAPLVWWPRGTGHCYLGQAGAALPISNINEKNRTLTVDLRPPAPVLGCP